MTPSSWSPAMIAAAFVGAAGLVASIAAAIVSVITTWRLRPIERAVAAIEGHVNSEKTADLGKITALQGENLLLRDMLTHQKTTAELLAQAAATATKAP